MCSSILPPFRPLIALLAIALLSPARTNAQSAEIRGVVRDSASGLPVSGAVVVTLDAIGATLSRTITGERGQYRLARPQNTMLVRAVRLGYRPATERLPSVSTQLLTLDFTLATVPRSLAAIDVSAARGCPARTDRAEAFALLDQARAGLLATVVARERQTAKLSVLRYERFLDLDGIDIERQVVHLDSSINASTSFNAVQTAPDFVERGFRTGTVGQYTYFGPDADVLLDERFQRGYCFSIASADTAHAAQMGLRFTPAGRRDGRVDIDGTLWIDTAARALTDITFKYVNVEALAESFNAGGRIGFRTLPNGVPFIDQWSIRIVGAPDTLETDAGVSSQVYAIREVGGELASARWPDGATWTGPLSNISITAVRRDGQPAANVELNFLGTDYTATTDNNGRATVTSVLPGPYSIVANDSLLSRIGVQIPTNRSLVARRATSALVRVDVPTAVQYVAGLCQRDQPGPNDTWLVARVVGNDGRPVAGAKWRVSEADGTRWRVVSENGITGASGVLRQCSGVRRNTSVEVAAWRDPKDAVRVQRIVDGPLAVVRIPLPTATVVASASRPVRSVGPSLMVNGTVRDSVSGAVVADARVTFLGTPFEGATDSSGVFMVGGIASGEYTVEVSTPSLDSIGAVARKVVSLTDKSASLSLFVPTIAAILSTACGSSEVPGFVVGRLATRYAGGAVPVGLRVVAEWTERTSDSTRGKPGWVRAPVDETGTFRLCGVPAATRIALRTESDTAIAVGSLPLNLEVQDSRRYARADLMLDSTVAMLASFTGTVIADTSGVPIENAEVTITDIGRTVLTNRRGAFRVSEIPIGTHLVSIKRVGFAPVMSSIDFDANRAVDQRVLLNKSTTTLATMNIEATGVGAPSEFDERRKSGIGRFMTATDLDKQGDRRLADVLLTMPGFTGVAGRGGNGWVVGKRAPQHIKPTPIVSGNADARNQSRPFNDNDLREQGYYCPNAAERMQGLECACYSQVYINNQLTNPGRPTEPFDINSIPARDIAGLEWYATPASTPGRYSALNAKCGVMVIWLRRR